MKRFAVRFDGADAGYVYAESVEAARRAAHAAYKRIHPGRESDARVRVNGEGLPVVSEAAEARQLVGEVYEGLRLLPGMETPAEKLRSALVLLETAVARDGADVLSGNAAAGGRSGGGGGDTELQEALQPVLESQVVPAPIKAKLRSLLEWVGLNTDDAKRKQIELMAFQTLWESKLIDLRFEKKPSCKLYKASAYLAGRLERAGALHIERFEGASDVDAFREALQPYGKEAAALPWCFAPATNGPEPVEVLRPLVRVGDRVLQTARLMRGVANPDPEVVALDRALFDIQERLKLWTDGLGVLADPHFKDKHRQFIERAEVRMQTARKQMAQAAKSGGTVLPTDTARRDLIKFLIDQVHRIQDALAVLPPDRSLREAFGDLVFKDVVFRGGGAYLTQRFRINIDTSVVEGADTQGLAGRFKKEPGGPRPREKTSRIHSVVVPCYTQDGTTVRPASVRLGLY